MVKSTNGFSTTAIVFAGLAAVFAGFSLFRDDLVGMALGLVTMVVVIPLGLLALVFSGLGIGFASRVGGGRLLAALALGITFLAFALIVLAWGK